MAKALSRGSWFGLRYAPSELGKRVVAAVVGDDEGALAERGRLLNNTAVDMAESGDRAGALDAVREAVTIRRRLAQANPAAYEPNLATSINNLANRLSETGDRAGALDVAREAVTIRRRLAQANPAAYEPDLAKSLCVLAMALSAYDQKKLAAESATEAVTRLRPWAAKFPEVYGDLLGFAEALVAKFGAP